VYWLLTNYIFFNTGLELKKHKVQDLCDFFGIVVDGPAHRAMGDVNRLSYIYQHTTFRLKYTVSNVIKDSLMASEIKWKPSK
jgi:DNA polymerase III epsilon subunit-like protein